MKFFFPTIFVITQLIVSILGSIGDRSQIFNDCLNYCRGLNCSVRSYIDKSDARNEVTRLVKTPFELNQPFYLKLLGWGCLDECKYNCMWETVDIFENTYKLDVPQFYGKWPFIRVFGIQEPVSAIASILNLIVHLAMIKKLRKNLSKNSPFKFIWYFFGSVSINAWVWSTLFHTRDTPFTERMDYFSAFALILVQFNSFFIRYFKLNKAKRSSKFIMFSIPFITFLFYLYHINYLSSVSFDYGYNMKMNVLIGALNSICWVLWCIDKYFRKKERYVWKCALSVFLFDVLMLFEVFDFSPLFWAIDSHALWHLSTVVIPYFWYEFLIDDDLHLNRKYYEKLF